MAEIKSTLDLVLEKTKSLTLSEDEKLSLKREELDKKIQGLVARYLDNFLSVTRLKEEMEKIEGDDQGSAYTALKKHLLFRFDLDNDNGLTLSGLSEVGNFNIAQLTDLQQEYQAEKEEAKRTFIDKALAALKERGISGSAVVPNLNKLPEWYQFVETLRKRYREKVDSMDGG